MLKNNKSLIKPSYNSLVPYAPGGDADTIAKEFGVENIIKLASNENPLGASEKALNAAQLSLKKAYRYPDSKATYLREKLSERYSCSKEKIIIGSGADSLIHAIAQTFISPKDEVIISQYAFASYEIATLANEGVPIVVPAKDFGHDLVKMQAAITQNTKLIFLANPNNPTGSYFSHEQFITFLNQIPSHILVILDEAYFEYLSVNRPADNFSLLQQFANLIILRTFSKAYGLAGFRVGYAFADPSIVELLNRIRSPFTISQPSLAAAAAAMDDEDFLKNSIQHNLTARNYFKQELQKLNLSYLGDQGNFLTVYFGDFSELIFNQLLKKGIILRPLKNYQMDKYLRITLGKVDDLKELIRELGKLL